MVALLDALVGVLMPGAALVGAVVAALAWKKGRPWAGVRAAAAGLWLLLPWCVLVLFEVVRGEGT